MPGRHAGWTRAGVVLTGLVILILWLTGVVLYAWPADDTAVLDSWHMEVRRAAVTVHGSATWLICLFAGRWIWPHVGRVWARSRTTMWGVGIAMLSLLLVAVSTGLALLYGPAAQHDWIARAHWWSALPIPAVAAWHAKRLVQQRGRAAAEAHD
ncbi:MAG TPA: hypothetical protein VHA82_11785 [Ramlibacter sp.]|uniref:hypothetical protein n=1 Tax=Ramlibacter sp. TaxID=1917967 RepID=UPI002BBC7F9F|nr:hypothetical protein [Ramlibacter sp.]HVZ44482.1 hypothetical protein [Ramlibacter sp.]